MGLFDFLTGDEQPEQLSGPLDPNARQVDYSSPAVPTKPNPQDAGFDWRKGLGAMGQATLAGASAGRGDFNYVNRLQAQMDQQMNTEKALKQREQEMGLRQLGAVKEAIPMMEWIRDNTDPTKREPALAQAYEFINQRTGGFFSKETFAGLMEGGSPALEEFSGAFALADELPPRLKTQLAKDWKDGKVEQVKKRIGKLAQDGATRAVEEGKEIPSKYLNALSSDERKNLQEQTSSKVFNTLMAVADKTVSMDGKPMQVRDMTPQQLRQNGIANFNMLTEDDKLELGQTFKNIKSKDVLKSELVEGRQDKQNAEISARQDKQIAATAANLMASINAQDARSARNQAVITQRMFDMQDAITKRIMQRPLEQGDREAISGMEQNLKTAVMLKTEFNQEELKKFIGLVERPAQELQQIFRDPNNPEAKKFARFQTLTNEVKGFAFAEGGKNLTNTEKQITWGHIPTGREFNVANYISNLDRTIEKTGDVIDRRITLSHYTKVRDFRQ